MQVKAPPRPSVTLAYVAYNRRDELGESLRRMLVESDYAGEVDAIVVDNASADGSAEMVREEFPQVRLIARETNVGAPAWNDGFAIATGDYVLILDDDCYLPPDGLSNAIHRAQEREADLVSFKVASSIDPNHVFTDTYPTGLLWFWGCAWLVRREVLLELGGYDPEIFIWANELEFMMRFFDRGYRHLHLPEVVARHMKPGPDPGARVHGPTYRIKARNCAYIAAKLLRGRDAVEALIALLARDLRDGLRVDRVALIAVWDTLRGFARGLRHRDPVRNAELSRVYRRNVEAFASPWWLSRPLGQLLRALPREARQGSRPKNVGRREQYYDDRPRYYPAEATTLHF
jgi:N-acetylglucosaminyl-diphospho-decaprenol L-rhamnosyltransferase